MSRCGIDPGARGCFSSRPQPANTSTAEATTEVVKLALESATGQVLRVIELGGPHAAHAAALVITQILVHLGRHRLGRLLLPGRVLEGKGRVSLSEALRMMLEAIEARVHTVDAAVGVLLLGCVGRAAGVGVVDIATGVMTLGCAEWARQRLADARDGQPVRVKREAADSQARPVPPS